MRFNIIPAIWLLCAVFPVFARDVEILLEDTELGLPLEGAVIRSWDGTQYICNEKGKALVFVPDDRRVVVQAAYPGYENGRLVITPETDTYTLGLRLSSVMQGKELVVEAAQPGTSETKTGRSVALSGREIAQTAEIGIIEDVMNSVKLLPGVGYAGLFNNHPSIRGGDPGDMSASLDGFYIMNPYYWGGGFSIFDPRMVQSAQLSHGVFSTRYGHTISGLLDVTSKKPSPAETEFELGAGTSAASFNLSIPFTGKGGILFMGRVTYYDPVIWLAQQLAKTNEALKPVNAIRTAPYIRSGTVTGNYRFWDNLELQATGFWGMDGVEVKYENSYRSRESSSDSHIQLDYTNYQGFITSALAWNPRNDMLLKLTAGIGFTEAVMDGEMQDIIYKKSFVKTDENNGYYDYLKDYSSIFKDSYDTKDNSLINETDKEFNVQGRIDYDWEPRDGLLFAAGIQERFSRYSAIGAQKISAAMPLSAFDDDDRNKLLDSMGITDPAMRIFFADYMRVRFPVEYNPHAENRMFTTSGYGLAEYRTPGSRFNAELGLRVDHFYLIGKDDFSLPSKPVLNPRLNMDFNVFKDWWILQSFDISAGTGLFSSINTAVSIAEKKYNLNEIKPNRSWTSVAGVKLALPEGLNFNIEGYYKYIFDRTYIPIQFSIDEIDIQPQLDGEGRVWGIDLMLQKLQSRFWDGWLSYSFSWAKYRDPHSGYSNMGISGGTDGNDWYFPSYHRFHNLNLVLNVKPTPRINIYTRFGLASGAQLSKRIGDKPISYPVYVYPDDPSEDGYFTERYYWPSVRDENNRTTPSLPMDIKFSVFGKNNKGRARYELYFAVENVLSLLYTSEGNTSFNPNTGKVDNGGNSASYEIPIPIPSFGIKYSY
ncbi:MAG: TonB-dependent receptor plug domain-containing protein [Treponema sp.]|nr:TonB-dependent receptor plug domain-containing protein [Treponema sp.]